MDNNKKSIRHCLNIVLVLRLLFLKASGGKASSEELKKEYDLSDADLDDYVELILFGLVTISDNGIFTLTKEGDLFMRDKAMASIYVDVDEDGDIVWGEKMYVSEFLQIGNIS